MSAPEPISSNHKKHLEAERNPLLGALTGALYRSIARHLETLSPQSLLDAGCGEGESLRRLGSLIPADYLGIDVNEPSIDWCRSRFPERQFALQSVLSLPFEDQRFDTVLSMEVLEHLESPGPALAELSRVSRRGLILSVPFEPWFQLGNLVRGRHLAGWGNHPEHVQHWGRRSFRRFLEQSGRVEVISVERAAFWLVALARPVRR